MAVTESFLFDKLPSLETERLMLRDVQTGDFEAIYAYSSNPVFYQSMGRSVPASKEKVWSDIQTILQTDKKGSPRNWIIVLKSNGQVIGDCGFNEYRANNRRGEINYAIDPNLWNQGFATEAALGVIRFGFETMHLNRIQAICNTANKASERVIQKAGMKYEGLLRNYIQFEGKLLDMKMYSLLRNEWQKGLETISQ